VSCMQHKSVYQVVKPPVGLKSFTRITDALEQEHVSVVIHDESRLCEVFLPKTVVKGIANILSVPIPDFQVSWAYKPTILAKVTKHDWLRHYVKACDCSICALVGSEFLVDGHLCTSDLKWMSSFLGLLLAQATIEKGGGNVVRQQCPCDTPARSHMSYAHMSIEAVQD
jgi:hypothetical protein